VISELSITVPNSLFFINLFPDFCNIVFHDGIFSGKVKKISGKTVKQVFPSPKKWGNSNYDLTLTTEEMDIIEYSNLHIKIIIDFAFWLWYTDCSKTNVSYNREVMIMPSSADIIRDSINEFSRLQNWMIAIKDTNPDIYNSMYDRYIELKVTLTSLGVNLTELDKIKN